MKSQRPAQSSLDLQSLFTQYFAVVRSFTQLCAVVHSDAQWAVVRSCAQLCAAVRSQYAVGAQPLRSGAQWVRSGVQPLRTIT
jgi:hypothetical protein